MRLVAILLAALVLLSAAAALRTPEYDEAYSIFLTAGDARPAWPIGVFHPGDVRQRYVGKTSLMKIARDLRTGDVHPPLYFWTLSDWRHLFGPSWFAARMLSVLFSLAALAALAWLATIAEIPAARAMLIALLSYGFAYTGITARGFALAQALNLFGMALILSAIGRGKHGRRMSLAAGLAFGAASFSNYLAVFVALAVFFWLCQHPRRRKILAPAALGYATFLPGLIFFFHAQRHSRIGQFQPFSVPHALALLAKDTGAALFGGLPVYAGPAGGIVTAALAVFAVISAGFAFKNWRPRLAVFGIAAVFVPMGLLTLGLLFNNTPIEIRYLAFAMPFVALVLAQTLPKTVFLIFLAVEACGIAGLMFAPSTMQPQAMAARQLAQLKMPAALVLVPFGNDGVGVPGPFIAAAPNGVRLEILRPDMLPDLTKEQSIILASIRVDDSSRLVSRLMLAKLSADPCWAERASTSLLDVFVRTCAAH